ncbi:MAG: hypothetical protein AAGC60_16960 [Acidobacteriota bacterium]
MSVGNFEVHHVEGIVVGHGSTVSFAADLEPSERLSKEAAHFVELGRQRLNSGRFREAIGAFARAIDTGPVDAEVYYYRAFAKLASGDPRRLGARRAASIEDDLAHATRSGARGHHLALLLYLRLAHHRRLGIAAPPPSPADLLAGVQRQGLCEGKRRELELFPMLRDLLARALGPSRPATGRKASPSCR